MNKIILLFVFAVTRVFSAQQAVKPEDLGAYAGIQAFSKQASLKPTLAATHPEKLHVPMTFDDRLATDGLLIFLDNTEKMLNPVSEQLLFALHQKACPILASTHLLKAIEETPNVAQFAATFDTPMAEKIRQYFNDIKKAVPHFIDNNPGLSQEEINKKIQDFLFAKASELDLKFKGTSIKNLLFDIHRSLIKEFTPWNRNEWLIKAVNQQLLLLVPRNYVKNRSGEIISGSLSLPSSTSLTTFEYKTGLKIGHMQTVTDYHAAIKVSSVAVPDQYFMDPLLKSSIFVSRAEYAQISQIYEQPRWALFINGHGSIGKKICGLSIPAFSQMLEFLDTKINTAFLTYSSCYSVGTNQKQIYKDLERPTKLSFPVATASAFDDVAFSSVTLPWPGIGVDTIDFQNKTLKVKYTTNFKQFIDLATSKNPDITLIASTVMPQAIKLAELAPHIRFGGSEWFTIDSAKNSVATIGTPFAQTCTKVDLIKRFSKKGLIPTIYCLYIPIIPCELVINSSGYKPFFFPMASLKTLDQNYFMYYIKKLSVPHHSLRNVHNMFTKSISDKYKLIAALDEIELKEIDDRTLYAEPQIIKDVFIIHNNPIQNVVWFTAQENFHHEKTEQMNEPVEKFYEIDFNKPILEKKEIKDYRRLRKTLGFTDAIAQFEKEKREPAQALENILKKKIERGPQ